MTNLATFKELLQQELEARAHRGQEAAVAGAIYATCLRLHIDPTNEGIRDYLTKGTISQQEGVIHE